MAEDTSRAAQEPFPPFVQTDDERRRWELCVRAVAATYGYQPGDTLDRMDRMLFWQGARALYHDWSMDTGGGFISEDERQALRAMGAL